VDNTNEYFDAWMKLQTQAFSTLREQGERMSSFYKAAATTSTNPFDGWRDAAFKAFSASNDGSSLKDTLANAFGGTNAVYKLFEIWQPMAQTMQNQPFNAGAFKAFMDTAKIKPVFDQLFNFDGSAILQMQEQGAQFVASLQKFSTPWNEALASNMSALPQLAEGNPRALFKMFQDMSQAFNNTAGRVFNSPQINKDYKTAELMSRFVERLSEYIACNIEFQQMTYKIGTEALHEVMQKLAAKIQSGGKTAQEAQSFDVFFELWIEVNENAFNKFFMTDEFSHLCDALTDSGFAARKDYFALIETQLADFPIVLRSEMNDLYKTVYDLRQHVKRLESQMKEEQA